MADSVRREFGGALRRQAADIAAIVTRHFGAAEAALLSANSNDFSTAKLELFQNIFDALRDDVDGLFARWETRLAQVDSSFQRPKRALLLDQAHRRHHLLLARNGRLPVSVCFSGLHGEEKDRCTRAALRLGASVSNRLYQFTTSYLVCCDPQRPSERVTAARRWGIAVVDLNWLDRSCEAGVFLPVDSCPQIPHDGCPDQHDPQPPPDSPDPERDEPDGVAGFAMALKSLMVEEEAPPASADPNALDVSYTGQLSRRVSQKRLRRSEVTGDPKGPAAKVPRGPPDFLTAEKLATSGVTPHPTGAHPVPHDIETPSHTQGGPQSQVVRWEDGAGAALASLQAQVRQRVFQFAGIRKKHDREALIAKIATLGGHCESSPHYLEAATHLIVPNSNGERTEKFLSFVAAGKWILEISYVDESQVHGDWLSEEAFRVFPVSSRIHTLQSAGRLPFSGWVVLLAVDPTVRAGLETILRAGGCTDLRDHLSTAAPPVTHVFSDGQKSADVTIPVGFPANHLRRLRCYNIEYIYQFLCNTGDPTVLDSHAVPLAPG